MYHSISDAGENGTHPYYQTNTSPSVFAEHMKFLHEYGYKVLNLPDAIKMLEKKAGKSLKKAPGLDSKYVVITFDDGFQDFYTQAFPVLERYGFTSTVYLPTAFIKKASRRMFKNKLCLTWNEVQELDKRGILFGSHTINHPVLVDLKNAEIENEIKQSKEEIENALGNAVGSFSYPYAFPDENGAFTKQLRNVLEKCGYENGVCTRIGTLTECINDKFFLSRIPVNSCDDARLFKAKLEGGYDWLQVPQILSKKIKG
jgi:peptidoglycan/xylan/chitin deacetylase (PgdA/CDA1 family)